MIKKGLKLKDSEVFEQKNNIRGNFSSRSHKYLRSLSARTDEHKLQKIRETLEVPLEAGYYESMPIKPGFMFFESLIKAPRAHISSLELNIPNSLYSTDKLYYIATSESGRVEVTTDIYYYKFMQILETYRILDSPNIFDRIAAVFRMTDENPLSIRSFVLDWDQFKVKMIGKEQTRWNMYQRYIKTPGSSPTTIRLYYKVNRANFAYFINTVGLEISDKNIHRCIVDTTDPAHLEIFKLAGKPIQPFEKEALKLILYLQKGYNLRISEIVLDFVRDDHNIIWLLGCKKIVFDSSSLKNALGPVENWWPDMQPSDKKLLAKPRSTSNKKELTTFILCKLCRLNYSNKELSHLVSVRILVIHNKHISARRGLPWGHLSLKVCTNDMLSQSVRICQYCYMIITSEFQLIKAENKMARLLNVPEGRDTIEDDPRLQVQLQFLPKEMCQWRVLLYITKLFNFSRLIPGDNYHIHIKLDTLETAFKVTWKEIKDTEERYIDLNMARVYYFFSKTNCEISRFLKDFMLVFTITDRYEGRVLGKGKMNPFDILCAGYQVGDALVESKLMNLNDRNDSPVATLLVTSGLSCDKRVKSNKVKVMLNRFREVYLAQDRYITTDPLPYQWMECFGDYNAMPDSFFKSIEDDQFYEPVMTNYPLEEPLEKPISESVYLSNRFKSKSMTSQKQISPKRKKKKLKMALSARKIIAHPIKHPKIAGDIKKNLGKKLKIIHKLADNF